MKLLTKLEKNKTFWYLLGFSILFFLLRLPSLIEPNWYGDEGIYQVIGQAIHSGRLLYTDIWDNKPPLLYIVYALFNGDQFQVRLFSLFTGIFATCVFYYLSRFVLRSTRAQKVVTILFVLLFATPLIEGNIANAENFMIPLILLAGLLVYIAGAMDQKATFLFLQSKFSLLLAGGFLLGVSFLFKIVAIFDFAAFFVFLFMTSLPPRFSFSLNRLKATLMPTMKSLLPFVVGFAIPIFLTGFYFVMHNAFSDFIRASFFSNVGYVGWKNQFIIPQGFLILKLLLLGGIVIFLYRQRRSLSSAQMFIFLWFVFSIFNTYFSGRPYMHYVLVSLCSFCLMLGLIFETQKRKWRYLTAGTLLIGFIMLNNTFNFNVKKSFKYYANTLSFLGGNKNVTEFQSFFDGKTPRDYELASFIKSHTNEKDTIFIWGDSAQIYTLSGKLPPGRYTVAYHITQYENGITETQEAINSTKPKYIISLKESRPIPFHVPEYNNKFVFEKAVIYERSL
jgi:hypothetical protein